MTHRIAGFLLFATLAGAWPALAAPRNEARFLNPIPWQRPHITQVIGLGYPELGIEVDDSQSSLVTVDGRQCVKGNIVAFDVEDAYAFDVDEPVALTFTYVPDQTTAETLIAFWDKNGGDGHGRANVAREVGERFRTVTITLDRARLAGLGARGVDIAVGARRGLVTLCDIAVSRSGETPKRAPEGTLLLQVKDAATGKAMPARVGIYDSTGRLPMPSDQALPVRRFADVVRRHWVNDRTMWPSSNRQAIYIDGPYRASLPAGRYEVAITRGPEYRAYHANVDIVAGKPTDVTVTLDRFQDLPAAGWYSGDSHLHLGREQVFDKDVWAILAAEDIHVGNLLEMGNIAGTYFKQPAWGAAGRFERDGYIGVSGQEDPRTGHRGHTIQWNLKAPIHSPARSFYSYHEVFEAARKQGALTGYAHLGEWFNGQRGLALDVPFGLVDFLEVLQGGRLNAEIWYSFLNLGYRVLPVAGADYPYFGPTLPGVERTYVKVDGALTADKWFDGVRRGQVYVTNGPFLDMHVNGHEMGGELKVARGTRLDVSAVTSLNPDIGTLDRFELVVRGEVAAAVTPKGDVKTELRQELVADKSMWVAVRAHGKTPSGRDSIAHSAPFYVVVDDQPTWRADKVEELVKFHRAQMQTLLTKPIDPTEDLEAFETGEALVKQWQEQLPAIRRRVSEAEARYDALLRQFAGRPQS